MHSWESEQALSESVIEAPRRSVQVESREAALLTVAAMFIGAFVQPVAARRWTADDFAAYTLVYRVLAVALPLVTFGATVSLPRALATSRTAETAGLVQAALGIALGNFLVLSAILTLPASLSFVPGLDENSRWAVVFLLAGAASVTMSAAALRGRFRARAANLVQLMFVGPIPVVAVYSFQSMNQAVLAIGAAGAIVGLLALLPSAAKHGEGPVKHLATFWEYGFRRVPGELALFSLLSIPPILAARWRGPAVGAGFAVSVSLITAVGSIIGSASDVGLPYFARAVSNEHAQDSLVRVQWLVKVAVVLMIPLAAIGAAAGPLGVRLYVGSPFAGDPVSLALTTMTLGPYFVYCTLRAIPDVYYHRPRSMYVAIGSACIAAVATIGLSLGHVVRAAEIGYCLGVWALGLGTAYLTSLALRDGRHIPKGVS